MNCSEALLKAARDGDLKTLQALLKEEKNEINVHNRDGWTPLQVACIWNHLNIVEELSRCGADMDDCNNDYGRSALWIAAAAGSRSIVKALIRGNADMNKSAKDGSTPLTIAIKNNHLDIADLLIQCEVLSIDPDTVDNFWKTFESKMDLQSFLSKYFIPIKSLKANNYCLWFKLIQVSEMTDLITHYVTQYPELASARQLDGFTPKEIADSSNIQALESVSLIHGRYKVLDNFTPVHISKTSIILKAMDTKSNESSDKVTAIDRDKEAVQTRERKYSKSEADKTIYSSTGSKDIVVLKLTGSKDHFSREIRCYNALSSSSTGTIHSNASITTPSLIAIHPDPIHTQNTDSVPFTDWSHSIPIISYIELLSQTSSLTNTYQSSPYPAVSIQDRHRSPKEPLPPPIISKSQIEQFYCIVTPYCSKTLFDVMHHEPFIGGNNPLEVRYIFRQLVECVEMLHNAGFVHGDIKPLNFVRDGSTLHWKLIDFDSSMKIGSTDDMDSSAPSNIKRSSAYLPPEVTYEVTLDSESGERISHRKGGNTQRRVVNIIGNASKDMLNDSVMTSLEIQDENNPNQMRSPVKMRFLPPTGSQKLSSAGMTDQDSVTTASTADKNEPQTSLRRRRSETVKTDEKINNLKAHPSFDIWSLGCILYQMTTMNLDPLFSSDVDDNLIAFSHADPAMDTLWTLYEWNDTTKHQKLCRVIDPSARNLMERMLSKDPLKRPTIATILNHPFLNIHSKVPRSVLTRPEYDIVIIHRSTSPPDIHFAERINTLLMNQPSSSSSSGSFKVWMDRRSSTHTNLGTSIPKYMKQPISTSHSASSTPTSHLNKHYSNSSLPPTNHTNNILNPIQQRISISTGLSNSLNIAEEAPLPQHNTEDKFSSAITNCRVVVCILSSTSINDSEVKRHAFDQISADSAMDPYLFKLTYAMELASIGAIQKLIPVLIGDPIREETKMFSSSYFSEVRRSKCLPPAFVNMVLNMVTNSSSSGDFVVNSDIVNTAVHDEIQRCMQSEGMGTPSIPLKGVWTTLAMILRNSSSLFIEGNGDAAFVYACDMIGSWLLSHHFACVLPFQNNLVCNSRSRRRTTQDMMNQRSLEQLPSLTHGTPNAAAGSDKISIRPPPIQIVNNLASSTSHEPISGDVSSPFLHGVNHLEWLANYYNYEDQPNRAGNSTHATPNGIARTTGKTTSRVRRNSFDASASSMKPTPRGGGVLVPNPDLNDILLSPTPSRHLLLPSVHDALTSPAKGLVLLKQKNSNSRRSSFDEDHPLSSHHDIIMHPTSAKHISISTAVAQVSAFNTPADFSRMSDLSPPLDDLDYHSSHPMLNSGSQRKIFTGMNPLELSLPSSSAHIDALDAKTGRLSSIASSRGDELRPKQQEGSHSATRTPHHHRRHSYNGSDVRKIDDEVDDDMSDKKKDESLHQTNANHQKMNQFLVDELRNELHQVKDQMASKDVQISALITQIQVKDKELDGKQMEIKQLRDMLNKNFDEMNGGNGKVSNAFRNAGSLNEPSPVHVHSITMENEGLLSKNRLLLEQNEGLQDQIKLMTDVIRRLKER